MRYDFLFQHEYKEIGNFRFPVYNDLTQEEGEAFDNIEAEQAENLFAVLTLAKRIAEDKGLPLDDVFGLLQKPDASQVQLLADYSAELQVVMANGVSARTIEKRIITVALRCRGEVKTPDGDWVSASDWTEELTGRLTRRQCQDIWAFLQTERAGLEPQQVDAQMAGKKRRGRPPKNSSPGAELSSAGSESTGTLSTTD